MLQFGPGGSAGGDRTITFGKIQLELASIRPRRLGRGGLRRQRPFTGGRGASIRPRRLGRGGRRRLSGGPVPAGCFNSAPAARPGGTSRPGGRLVSTSVLQFGPGGSAGGDRTYPTVPLRHRNASIRPRRLGRGGQQSARTSGRCTKCFNSAPAARPGGTGIPDSYQTTGEWLQFGPGGSAGGDAWRTGGKPLAKLASIRPRRLGRGGPRPRQTTLLAVDGFNSAPAARPGGTRSSRIPRDSMARFNSAPAARPGGTRLTVSTVQHRARLQFGPGGSAGGDLVLTESHTETVPASIRPRRLGRGGRWLAFASGRTITKLQFGPGGSAGGDFSVSSKAIFEGLLQFGPGGSAGGDSIHRKKSLTTT